MSILVFIELENGRVKKASQEAAAYAASFAAASGHNVQAVALGSATADELAALGRVGVSKVHHLADGQLDQFDAKVYAAAIAAAVEASGAEVIVFSHNYAGKHLAGRLSARLQAGLVAGAVGAPDTTNGFVVKKNAFSGKGYAFLNILTDKKIISISPNSFNFRETDGTAEVAAFSAPLPAASVRVVKRETLSEGVPLTEAELVVSAGRGLKGPENWNMIEELATTLGAATACSRPVSDVGWRPHHEHVGQTGITISPNLYVAVGISGAIQHLAGVNQSKTIVVINKDSEAPFFKAADYGIVGDAFDVIPQLNAALKKYKAGSN